MLLKCASARGQGRPRSAERMACRGPAFRPKAGPAAMAGRRSARADGTRGGLGVVPPRQYCNWMVELIPRQVLFGNPERVSPSISPDGTQLAWIAPHEEVLNVWVAPASTEAGVDWAAAR